MADKPMEKTVRTFRRDPSMRLHRSSPLFNGCAVFLAAVLLAACDPKAIGSHGDGGGDEGGDDTENPPEVSTQAIAAGQVIALHMDLISMALASAGQFDAPSSIAPRSIFPTSCITATTIDASFPYIDLSLDSCVDAHGTQYRGKALLAPPVDETDGFLLAPYFDAANKIIATNETDPTYNHTVESGTLLFTFTRGGTGDVSNVEVSNFIRHSIFTTIASFTYMDVRYTGALGSLPQWPGAGGSIQASWEDVGVFTVELNGSSQASFTLNGVAYNLDLSTGQVTLTSSS
jgi:hypothetical protein